ncbi:3-coathanger stack domain-containing protein [Flavilitoribacter nigricans]|uniref:Ig-like domain-containing protein n=1 Tax=Flavilitoribacter nigricans (strain ATCC 23147 / DSM 23189 / NBRC 102662 / NCIMB 1420 / SS-2) TaxID=1122177 RepID=A0A2D0NIA2_FLAN2|nr:3-coathanger stack domain-containing protein [Flavilitoribacter nigricans]PHN08221.1 hypothetical protein CRP01_02550 [Flavilitoribacter nigricans DSM 23189 = NBRC 102662]
MNRSLQFFCSVLLGLFFLLPGLSAASHPAIANAKPSGNAGFAFSPEREADSLVLVTLYNATDGPNWRNTWDLNQPMDTWYGIQLNAAGQVVCIDMDGVVSCAGPHELGAGNGLKGTLPDLDLPQLRYLNLWRNNVSGALPNFTSLPELVFLDLGENNFDSQLPALDLPKLETLLIDRCNFSGPFPTFNLPALKELDITSNNFTAIPDLVGVPALERLTLSGNNYTGNIPDFSNIPNLKYLFLGYTTIEGPIPDFSNLPILEEFTIARSNINAPLTDFSNLPNLKKLEIGDSKISGTISDFSNLPNLTRLSLRRNQLEGAIPDFSNLPNLIFLIVEWNQLTGSIPEFSSCPKLQWIVLSYNQLSGPLPALANLQQLTHFFVGGNNLEGLVPDYQYLSAFFYFIMVENHFTFEDILPNFEALSTNLTGGFTYYLQKPILRDTTITVPENTSYSLELMIDDTVSTNVYTWYKNDELLRTIIGQNTLDFASFQYGDAGNYRCEVTNPNAPELTLQTENIQLEISNLSCRTMDSLTLVSFYETTNGPNWINTWDLTQPMATWFGVELNEAGCVYRIDLDGIADFGNFTGGSGNNLMGEMPDLQLPHLIYLDLGANALAGALPDFSGMGKLLYLYLGNNNFTGNLPDFSMLPELVILDVSVNFLTGSIPDFSNLPQLQRLELISTRFNVPMPDFSGIPKLERLNITNNNMPGPIPNFSNLPVLRSLFMGANKFTCLPDFNLCDSLSLIYIHQNELSCSLPDLTHLPLFRKLWIQNNDLTFEDLLPGFDQLAGQFPNPDNFIYAPQRIITYDDPDRQAVEGELATINLEFDEEIASNIYSWYKDGELYRVIEGTNKLSFVPAELEDAGDYYCLITNPNVPDLTLQTTIFSLSVQPVEGLICDDEDLTLGPGSIPNDIYRAAFTLDANGLISPDTTVGMVAGEQIRLLPGFHAAAGATFRAFIEPCEIITPPQARTLPEVLQTDQKAVSRLEIFPNPGKARTTLLYRLPKTTNVKILLVDLNGRSRVISDRSNASAGDHELSIDLRELHAGIYVVQLITDEGKKDLKLVVLD